MAICLDERMLYAAFVLLASIKDHATRDRPVTVHVVTTFESRELHDLAAAMDCGSFAIEAITVEDAYGNLPMRDHITRGTYLRFLLPDLLSDLDKVIYLDADTVVHHDLAPLFDVDLAGRALAAMPDYSMLWGSRTWPTFFIPYEGTDYRFAAYAEAILDLPCPKRDEYFNCGVLLVDLEVWRRNKIAQRTLEYLVGRPGLYLMDQDALNHVVNGAYVALDPRWNAFASCAFPAFINAIVRFTRAGRDWEGLRGLWRKDPWIVHYAGANKPWIPHEPKTYKDNIWWRYAARSPMAARVFTDVRAREVGIGKHRSKIPRDLRHADACA